MIVLYVLSPPRNSSAWYALKLNCIPMTLIRYRCAAVLYDIVAAPNEEAFPQLPRLPCLRQLSAPTPVL